jgi:iron complex outermembrane receptor protein
MNYDLRYTTDEFADGWRLAAGVGGMYQESDNLGEEVLIPAYRLFDSGLFVTTTKNWDRFTLAGGVRADMRHLSSLYLEDKFDAFERDFTGVTGSVGLVYSPARNLNLRANVARGFRAPNLSELASNGVHEGTVRYEKGNKRLDPEFSLQGDLGADLQLQHVSLTAALFCNRIDNYIYALRTGTVIGSYDEYRYDATDALLYGAEFAADCHPFHALHLGADFSYVRGRFQSSDMPLIPAPKVGAEVKWEITQSGKILNNSYLSVRADHHFRQDHYLQGTETATDAYLLVGASAHTDIMCKGKCVAQLSLIADNLTDKVYVDHLSRLKYVGIRNPGRNITLKLNIPL